METTKQFLFRLYCKSVVYPIPLPDVEQAPISPFETMPLGFVNIDTLVSCPPDTVDLVSQANSIAQAYSILCVNNVIYLIAVFQLSPDIPADSSTPVMVLHGFKNESQQNPPFEVAPSVPATWQNLHFMPQIAEYGDGVHFAIGGYPSYDLSTTVPYNLTVLANKLGAYHLSMSRECDIGRAQKTMIASALDSSDITGFPHDTVKLRTDSALWRLRWPLFRKAMNKLPYQHSGYHLQIDGSVKIGRIAQGDFIPSGVTIMATQTKQLMRREVALSAVAHKWFSTVARLTRCFDVIEQFGYSGPRTIDLSTQTPIVLQRTAVQSTFVRRNLTSVVEFLNLVGVAQGNNRLLLSEPDSTPETRSQMFTDIVQQLTRQDGTVTQIVSKGEAQNLDILMSIHQLTANLIRIINEFQKQVLAFWSGPIPTATGPRFEAAQNLVAIYTQLAQQWPKIQADLYRILCLLLTWNLAFDPYENGHGKQGGAQIDFVNARRYASWKLDALPNFTPQITSWPSITTGKFAEHLPEFAPVRIWPVEIVESGADAQIAAQQAEDDAAAVIAQLQAQADERAQAKQVRTQRRALEMERILADYDSAVPPWFSEDSSQATYINSDRLWYEAVTQPMDEEVRERAELFILHNRNSGIASRPKLTPAEAEQNQAGDGAEFITIPTAYDPTLPTVEIARWVRRSVDGAPIKTIRTIQTADGEQDTDIELKNHVVAYADVASWLDVQPYYHEGNFDE